MSDSNEVTGSIKSVSREARLFPPPPVFAARARLGSAAEYERLYRRSIDDPDGFWGDAARAELAWMKPFTRVLDWQPPQARWFDGGEPNLSANCLDRHLAARADKVALLFEGEPGDERRLTYAELHAEVCRFANV